MNENYDIKYTMNQIETERLREIWNARLPVKFTLDQKELSDVHSPMPLFLMVPRISYFPIVWDKVRKHFLKHTRHSENTNSQMWLDFNGTPLKWHYPIGLLHDLYSSDIQLPWTVTVHFDKYPDDQIFKDPCLEAVESHFLTTLKEADALKHKIRITSSLVRKEFQQFWIGLENDKFDQFWKVNNKLMDSSANEGKFRNIPFRIYISDDEPFIQRAMKPILENGKSKTLLDLLKEVLSNSEYNEKTVRVVTHGISLPLDVPLQWMSEHLSYPDNFLHLFIPPCIK